MISYSVYVFSTEGLLKKTRVKNGFFTGYSYLENNIESNLPIENH